jgi:hypothetical protein
MATSLLFFPSLRYRLIETSQQILNAEIQNYMSMGIDRVQSWCFSKAPPGLGKSARSDQPWGSCA